MTLELPASFQLRPEHAGKRAEKVLLRALPGLREGFALMLLHRGKVLLDGRPLRRGERLPRAGRVEVQAPDPRPGPRLPVANPDVPLTLRHEDADVLVVEKPAGLAMHPGPGHGANTLQNGLVARYPELLDLGRARGFGLVQRLDRDTSGLVVVARSARAHEALVAAFTAREVTKRYRALVLGAPPAPEGTVDAPVDGREATSRWEVLGRAGEVSLLRLHPLTGRKHQLRVHLAGLGCPILGDRTHGPATLPVARRLGLPRLALHAEALALRHPVSGAPLAFEAPWPPDLEAAWRRAQEG
ncbi:MAG: RluA family pseudouridine synthase [Planctomycetes bacterium]|nr:RluA family pseudouridine synthase [Planctomycetota bacterium]